MPIVCHYCKLEVIFTYFFEGQATLPSNVEQLQIRGEPDLSRDYEPRQDGQSTSHVQPAHVKGPTDDQERGQTSVKLVKSEPNRTVDPFSSLWEHAAFDRGQYPWTKGRK